MAGWRDKAKTSGGMRDLKSLFWTLCVARNMTKCPLKGVLGLREVSVSRGSTVSEKNASYSLFHSERLKFSRHGKT